MNDEWTSFLNCTDEEDVFLTAACTMDQNLANSISSSDKKDQIVPPCSELYISTQTKIAYLDTPLPLIDLFWSIDIMDYGNPMVGFIKKQIKLTIETLEQEESIELHLKKETQPYFVETIHKTEQKDVRKISVGMSKKDMNANIIKRKSAFYNCFVVILRMACEDQKTKGNLVFKDFHVKIFNTGKIEVPGIQTQATFDALLKILLSRLQKSVSTFTSSSPKKELTFFPHTDTVLINSNFNCGFFIKRDVLFALLKSKYELQCIYDPCSYPGIQCKFYYDPNKPEETQHGQCVITTKKVTEDDESSGSTSPDTAKLPSCLKMDRKRKHPYIQVSFMIFRTGSVLIVGMCEERIIDHIYRSLKNILKVEYETIVQKQLNETPTKQKKLQKCRKRMIYFENNIGSSTPPSSFACSNTSVIVDKTCCMDS